MPHVVLVTAAAAADTLNIRDHGAAPAPLPAAVLAEARARLRKAKHRLIEIPAAHHGVRIADTTLREAVDAGVRACVASLRGGAIVPGFAGNFGLSALDKWAALAAAKSKKAWPAVFRPGPPLYVARRQTYFWIEAAGTGGGGFRPQYAAFLRDAAERLARPALRDVAGRYDALGDQWTALARHMLPDDSGLLGETRRLLDDKRDALRTRGPLAGPILATANQRLDEIERAMSEATSLAGAESRDLYADLAAQLRALHTAEMAAVDALERAISALA